MRHNFGEKADFTNDMSFGAFLKKKRRLMGLNQTDFGAEMLIDPNTISKWETGKTSPPIETARMIIEDLGGELLIINHKDAPKGKLKVEGNIYGRNI